MKTFVASPEIDSWQDLAVRFRLNFWLSTRAISANLYNDNGDDEDDDLPTAILCGVRVWRAGADPPKERDLNLVRGKVVKMMMRMMMMVMMA